MMITRIIRLKFGQASADLKEMAGGRLITIFQPHLFSRTRDFYKDFARELAIADEDNSDGYISCP